MRDRKPGRLGDLDQRAGQPAAREVAQAVDVDAGLEQRQHRLGQRRAVALDRGLEAKPLARRHDGDAVAADVAADRITASPGRTLPGRSASRRDDAPDARRC